MSDEKVTLVAVPLRNEQHLPPAADRAMNGAAEMPKKRAEARSAVVSALQRTWQWPPMIEIIGVGVSRYRKNYTSALAGLCVLMSLCASLSVPSAQAATPHPADNSWDFSQWHWPVPAGLWYLSQGPCGAPMRETHGCNFYEDQCAVDIASAWGSAEGAPVLAPWEGETLFAGNRPEAGLTLMLRHPDGRVSVFMHLDKIAVGLDESVAQGQVIGYVGGTGDTLPHLHFFVQPNAVERTCIPLAGVDEIDYVKTSITSHNTPWEALNLAYPPADLPTWLPQLATPADNNWIHPAQVTVAPGAVLSLPVAWPIAWLPEGHITFERRTLRPTLQTAQQMLYTLPWTAPTVPGDYRRTIRFWDTETRNATRTLTLTLRVAPAPNTRASLGVLEGAPTYLSPASWSETTSPTTLCWQANKTFSDAQAPLAYRVLVVGPYLVDSGWQTTTCWATPTLGPGIYYWKVLVRDQQGWLNRTTQRPWVFRVK